MATTRHNFVVGGEGTTPDLRVNRQGSLVSIDNYAQWVLEGRVFCSSDGVGDDTVTAISGWVVTTPQLLIDVPLNTTIIPLWVVADQQGTVSVGDTGNFVIMYDGVDRYNSGGNSEAITNMRTDDPYASKVAVYTTPTANAATAARVLWNQQYEIDDGTKGTNYSLLDWSARHNFTPLLVGPAAFMLWIDDKASVPDFGWSLGWAEFKTSDIIEA